MNEFKVGDEVEAVSESFTWGLVRAGDLGVVKSLRGDEYFVSFPNQSTWRCYEKDLKLVKPKWTIYNNTLPWSQLSDKQKGKLLLAAHSNLTISVGNIGVIFKPAFDDGDTIYIALEPVKPEPTMAELFFIDWQDCLCVGGKQEQKMIAKGWTKPC
jgi:hypothetical protein